MSSKHSAQPICLICQSADLVKYLDLGESTLANAFVEKSKLGKKEPAFPLQVFYCQNCHLAQLVNPVDRALLFKNYAYFSSASSHLEDYFKAYVENVHRKFPKQSKKLIVEIGSNDGILLRYFKKYKTKILGIDPAKNIVPLAEKNGVPTLPIFFNSSSAKKILKDYGPAGVIIANHVLAHTDDMHSIIKGVQTLLDRDGVFVFEVQYVLDLLQKKAYDNTYHEHVSYFSLAPLATLLGKHGMQIFNVERVDAQGGSIRVYAGHAPLIFPIDASVKKMLAQEKKAGLHDAKTYIAFGKKPQQIKKDVLALLQKLKKQNKTIAGYGASAKGNTFLQYAKIGPDTLAFIVDTTLAKQGKFTPGTHIPIYAPSHLEKNIPDYILILAWNYADLIMEKEKGLKKKGVKFIKTVPKIQII